MAAQHRMIEPFEPEQVKVVDGKRVVSFGTSSYGYDVRCAAEFRIFTNINSAIVDPKDFDSDSFVDVNSDVCIIVPEVNKSHITPHAESFQSVILHLLATHPKLKEKETQW